ncbi:MAG: DinB family protein [Pseudobacteriovorax sp.]|nr:DinB family protein [Pseudobacteriovorax sp.]
MTNHLLVSQLNYKSWCNQRLYSFLQKKSEDTLTAKHKISFGSIQSTLHHVMLMDEVWKHRILGQDTDLDTRVPQSAVSFADLMSGQRKLDSWFVQYSCEASQQELSRLVSFRFIGGDPYEMTVSDILFHVVNHGSYHRGHVVAILNLAGDQPLPTDYPVFLKDR